MGSQPTSATTPATPSTTPVALPAVKASPVQIAATTAVNSTVVEFRMAASEAVSSISAKAIREKGMAEFTSPRIRNLLQWARALGSLPMATP